MELGKKLECSGWEVNGSWSCGSGDYDVWLWGKSDVRVVGGEECRVKGMGKVGGCFLVGGSE